MKASNLSVEQAESQAGALLPSLEAMCESSLVAEESVLATDTVHRGKQLTRRVAPWWKRSFDVVVSAMLLVLLSPLLLAITVYIRIVSKGPALFKQDRLGWMGQDFTILKFRTMHAEDTEGKSECHRSYVASLMGGEDEAKKPDYTNRLIPGGKFLRSSSLDELPQLINVLKGQMSLIGPRPDVLQWEDYPAWQRHRFEVLPGITGLWQVSGKNRLTFDRMVELDLEYCHRRSIKLDAWILLKTVKLVLSNENH